MPYADRPDSVASSSDLPGILGVARLAFEIAEFTCSPGFVPTKEDWEFAELLATFG